MGNNRITQTLNGQVHAYEYWPSSNRIKAIHTGTLAGAIEKSFVYDDEGRLTSQAGACAKTLVWDQKNRARQIASGTSTLGFAYDPMNYRIGRNGGTLGNHDYYLEGEHLEAEYSGANLQAKYFRGLGTDELVAGFAYDANGNWLPAIYHHDTLMSVTGISAHDGAPVQTASYSAFGDRTVAASGASTNRLKYTGRELDADTGLYYYRARYYDPSIGRFVSEDPLGFGAGLNFYAYVANNPVNANDPSGSVALVDNAIGGLVNVGIGLTISCTFGSCSDYGPRQIAIDFAIGFATNGLAAFNTARRVEQAIAGMSSTAKGVLGRDAGEVLLNQRGSTIIAKEVPVRTPVGSPRVDAIVRDAGTTKIKGVEYKMGEGAPTPVQEAAYPYINRGAGKGELFGSHARQAGIEGEFIDAVEYLAFSPKSYVASLSETLPSALGLDLGYQLGTFSTPAAGGGFLLYPNKSNLNNLLSVYSK